MIKKIVRKIIPWFQEEEEKHNEKGMNIDRGFVEEVTTRLMLIQIFNVTTFFFLI